MTGPMEFPERFNMAWYFLDRNVEEGRGDKTCLFWREEAYTYREVLSRANRFGNARTGSCSPCPTGRSSPSPGSRRPRWAR